MTSIEKCEKLVSVMTLSMKNVCAYNEQVIPVLHSVARAWTNKFGKENRFQPKSDKLPKIRLAISIDPVKGNPEVLLIHDHGSSSEHTTMK